MNRRDIIKYTAVATGATLSAPLISSILSGCQPELKSEGAHSFFTIQENEFLISLIDTILPATDSPSASEVNVHQTIDSMVRTVYTAEHQKAYRSNFELLFESLNSDNTTFTKKSSETRLEDLQSIAMSESADLKAALTEIKQQAIAYYLSTKEIGKNFLNYLPVPGPYQGCISLTDVESKSWAL